MTRCIELTLNLISVVFIWRDHWDVETVFSHRAAFLLVALSEEGHKIKTFVMFVMKLEEWCYLMRFDKRDEGTGKKYC